MLGILYLLWAVSIIFTVFLIFQAVGGKLLGAKIEEIGLFNSPRIFKFNVGGIILSFNALPLGCFVKFDDNFQNLHPLRKIVIVLLGLAAYLLISFVTIGFAGTFEQVISGFGQIFYGLFSPIAVGAVYFEKLAAILTEQSFLKGLGILAGKFLAFNLIPLGSLHGGMILIYLLELFGLKSEKFNEKFQIIGLLLLVPLYIAYIIAFIVFVWRSL